MTGTPLNPRAWRRIAEAKIEQAIQNGEFKSLPGFGQPLNFDPDENDENWWIKRKAKLEKLSLLPPALELQRLVERELQRITTLETEAEVRAAGAKLNETIAHANRRIGWGPPSRTMPIDIENIVSVWRTHQSTPKNDSPGLD